jgi:hypothetical protein
MQLAVFALILSLVMIGPTPGNDYIYESNSSIDLIETS